jgi:hypothetical protein
VDVVPRASASFVQFRRHIPSLNVPVGG